ncbi:MAG: TlpA disulfide reductase family protein, partial [Pyrinomonadaceae bacterium]
AIFFSSFTACSSTAVTTGNNAANAPVNGRTTSAPNNNYPPVASGLAEAPFELIDGTTKKLADYKGKVIMMNVWGIWCGPCRAEMPHLVEMQEKYREKGFEIIGLNIGDQGGNPEKIEEIQKFSDQMKLNYTLARIQGPNIRQFYAVTKQEVVPQTILVDRDGRLRGVFIGGGQRIFDSMMEVLDKTMAE